MKNTLLKIKDLQVVYKTDVETVHAVNRISFSLEKGETIGIVGETGAGKTTTALSILRLLPERTGQITGGKITFCGIDLLKLPESRMRDIRDTRVPWTQRASISLPYPSQPNQWAAEGIASLLLRFIFIAAE